MAKKKENRDYRIPVHVTKEEKKRFEEQAKKKGMAVSAWLRSAGITDIAINDW